MLKRLALYLIICLPLQYLAAQDANTIDTATIRLKSPEKYIDAVADKAKGIEEKLNKKSEKALAQLKKQENKIIKKLEKIDSTAAKQLKENATARYKELEEKLKNPGKLQQYIPHLDSLGTSLNFLTDLPAGALAKAGNSQLLKNTKEVQDKLKDAITKVDALKAQLQKAENLKQFLKERKEYLREKVTAIMNGSKASPLRGGLEGALKQLNKKVYYYSQQIAEYKEILKDPKKIEKKALELLAKTKFFQEFMRKNSMLASLFRMPGDPNDPSAQASLAGLQTRAQVNSLIQTQIAAGGPNAMQQFQQNLQAAQTQLNQLKDKFLSSPSGDGGEMPEGFKPNSQKTKSFLQRIELGTNIQNQKSNGLLPTTSDLGLSVGFKINDKSIIGVGSSFKMGWGKNIQHIQLSGQGASLRSFVDIKLKGSFWISGGYEMKYRNAFKSIASLQNYNAWQQSGLIGVSKVVSIKSKLFKKTKLMLLWDILSNQQIPRAQPIVFRVGYSF
jgi:hypothetical protein